MVRPSKQVRAVFSDQTIRVYQAYSDDIARVAIAAQTLKHPFKRDRMTWIKPSFTWMMYRSGWASKNGQERILGIDISRDGFEWALSQAAPSQFEARFYVTVEEWQAALRASSVRVQWDPERTLNLAALSWKTIQVGLSGPAVDAYVDRWIVRVEDVTQLAKTVESMVALGDLDAALARAPVEQPYPLPEGLIRRVGGSLGGHAGVESRPV